ncbi:MAG: hypothetical protein C0404_11190 [Verrucomicrobia bacterium]|nr:hypothetical protein [Verrucomicrobiota bacterium]
MLVILYTLAATLAIQSGYFLWKLAADSLPRLGEVSTGTAIRGFLRNGRWLTGLLCTVVGWLLFIKATDLGEISIVQPLMSVGDLFLVLLAVAFLHERLTRTEWMGLTLTVAGAFALSFEARVTAPLFIDWPRLTILLILAIGTGAVLWLRGLRSKRPEVPLAIAVGFGFGTGALLTKLMTAYIALNGGTLESGAFLINPILPFMVAANVMGLVLLQMAFQRGRAAVIVPVQLSVVNGMVVVAGALVFSEPVTLYRLSAIGLIVAGTAGLHRAETATEQKSMLKEAAYGESK